MHCTLHWDEIPVGHILTGLYTKSRKYKVTENVQHKRHITAWCFYYSNIDWNLLTCVIQKFIKTFHYMKELRVTGT